VAVLLPLLPSVVEGAAVSNSVIVFPADTRVSVGVGLKETDVLAAPDEVAFPVAPLVGVAEVPSPLFCRTIRESSSGSHRGQGHAVVNVERNRNIIE
jgi:hypothetical protein